MLQLETTTYLRHLEANPVPEDSRLVNAVQSAVATARDFRDRWNDSTVARQRLRVQDMEMMAAFAELPIEEQNRRFADSSAHDLDLLRNPAEER